MPDFEIRRKKTPTVYADSQELEKSFQGAKSIVKTEGPTNTKYCFDNEHGQHVLVHVIKNPVRITLKQSK